MTDRIEFRCSSYEFPRREDIHHAKQFSINETLILPCGKPDIEHLVEVTAHPRIEDCEVIETPLGEKIIIKAVIEQKVVYLADVPCQSIHEAHFEVPVCTFIEVPSRCSSGHHFDISCPGILIEFMEARKMGPRQIAKCAVILVWIRPGPHLQSRPQPPSPHPCHSHHHHDYCSICQKAPGCHFLRGGWSTGN